MSGKLIGKSTLDAEPVELVQAVARDRGPVRARLRAARVSAAPHLFGGTIEGRVDLGRDRSSHVLKYGYGAAPRQAAGAG